MNPKHDRTFTRTAPDLERKYPFGAIEEQRKNTSQQSEKLSQLTQSFNQYVTHTNEEIKNIQEQVKELAPDYDELGVGLKITDRKLCVDSATDFEGDNTRPVEAAFMQLQIGNIEELLKTI